jgi:hypothetical protein
MPTIFHINFNFLKLFRKNNYIISRKIEPFLHHPLQKGFKSLILLANSLKFCFQAIQTDFIDAKCVQFLQKGVKI